MGGAVPGQGVAEHGRWLGGAGIGCVLVVDAVGSAGQGSGCWELW